MIDNWQAQARINPLQEIQQVHAELFHLGGSACPSCRQFNVKVCKAFHNFFEVHCNHKKFISSEEQHENN